MRRPSLRPPLAPLALLALASCGSGEPEAPSGPAPSSAPPARVELEQAAPESGSAEPSAPAKVRGLVRFVGDPPPRQALSAVAGTAGCHHDGPAPMSETVIVENGMLANCIVYVSKGLSGHQAPPVPSEPVVLDQQGCVYRPHVVALRTGQKLRVKNSDPTSHNVNVQSKFTSVPNRTQAAGGQDLEIVFQRSEPAVKVGCDIHPWMGAWIGVFDHPFFAVTGTDGAFEIAGLPPGKYTLTAWHERYDRRSAELELPAGGVASVEFSFAAK